MKKYITASLLIILLVLTGCNNSTPDNNEKPASTPKLENESVVTGTGVLEPDEKYVITASVTGDVVSANFEEGQIVEKGALLYSIDKTAIQNEISRLRIGVEQAELAQKQNSQNIRKQTVTSTVSGTVKAVNVINGGSIMQSGQIVCEIVDDRIMLLKVPFLVSDIAGISVGQAAQISLIGTFFEVTGNVSKILAGNMVSQNGSEVKMVEIALQNPGTITPADKATAKIGDITCADVGTFEYSTNEYVTAEGTGTIIDVPIKVGDYVNVGSVVLKLSTENLDKLTETHALSIKAAKTALDAANTKLKDYSVASPARGTVISKNVKAHDTISQANMNNLAVIADLESIRFKMSVDEMDVTKIKIGQSVEFTAEAVPDCEFIGSVSYISDTGTAVGDVTLYEIRVSVTNSEELKAGMNVSAKIQLD